MPLSPSLPDDRLALLLQRSRLSALIVDERGRERLAGPLKAAAPARILSPLSLAADAVQARPAPFAPSALAYLIFTSGTTGTPKGVMITAANLASYVSALRQLYSFTRDDRFSQCPDLSWDLSVFDLYAAWDCGGSLHVVPEGQRLAPARFIAEQRLTVWCSAPSVVAAMEEMHLLREGAFPSVKVSMFCGEPLTARTARAWQRAAPRSVIDNHFGPTEATCSCLYERLGEPLRLTASRNIVAIGRPFPEMRAALVDGEGRFVGEGEAGEVVLAGPQVAAGYFDEPELTSRRFRTLVHRALGALTWYFTGDQALVDAEGHFHHLGRIDNQVKVFGKRIELEEVEVHLRLAAGTDSVAAVAWPRKDGLPVGLVGFVGGATVEAAHVREQMLRSVPVWLVPRRIVALEALPATPNGKIDRRALLALLDAGE